MKSSPRATIPRELLWNLTLRELRGKYKRSFLGWGWSLLNPIVFLGIYSFVFTVLFKQTAPVGNPSGIQVYPLFLVCGLVVIPGLILLSSPIRTMREVPVHESYSATDVADRAGAGA